MDNNKNLLVYFQSSSDNIDPLTLYGFRLFNNKEYSDYLEKIKTIKDISEIDFYYSEDVILVFNNIEEYLDCLKVTEINSKESVILEKLFGLEWGQFLHILDYLENEIIIDSIDVD